jgi:hypothetical protein
MARFRARLCALVIATAPAWAAAVPADVVTLKSGAKVEGRVVFESDEKVVVRSGSRDREIERGDVAEVESVARSLKRALETWDSLHPTDVPGTLELARTCKANGLPGEARVLALHVLAQQPHVAAAHEIDDLAEGRGDWGKAWTLETTHYDLRTNLPLADACSVALELELLYRAFHGWFGPELGLYEVVEPLGAEVHARKGSYPESNDRLAYFDASARMLFVDASGELPLGMLIHEGMHQLLFAASSDARGDRGAIPAWVDEGLAEYGSWSREGERGRARYSKGAPSSVHFARHRAEDKPYDLSRVLSLSSGDFLASSKVDLKYGQSYTLVHFCMHGENERWQKPFLAFLRGALDGRGSTTDFKKELGFKEREFEKAWHEYARRH